LYNLEPVSTLKEWVARLFSPIQNLQISPPSFPGHPLTKHQLLNQVFIKPVKEMRTLDIIFPLNDYSMFYKTNPSGYWANLIGHEGKGSILSLLKAKGYALGLSAGSSTTGGIGFDFFRITIDLTNFGVGIIY
jgi:insulysin